MCVSEISLSPGLPSVSQVSSYTLEFQLTALIDTLAYWEVDVSRCFCPVSPNKTFDNIFLEVSFHHHPLLSLFLSSLAVLALSISEQNQIGRALLFPAIIEIPPSSVWKCSSDQLGESHPSSILF